MIEPVCGMTVEPTEVAAAWEHQGTTYYFCSVGCWQSFKADPEKFLSMDQDDRKM